MPIINIIAGVWLILFAIFKFSVCVIDLIPPEYLPINLPFISHDTTTAGLYMVVILFGFSIFTFLHGLSFFDLLPKNFDSIITRYSTQYIVYITLALLLVVFFSLVLFTNLPINKDKENYSEYEIVGLGGGALLIVSVLMLEVFRIITQEKNKTILIIAIPCTYILLTLILTILLAIYYINKDPTVKYKLGSAILIPLATI